MPQLTKNRIRLLGIFYANPDHSFYIQEIGRILKLKPGIFQRTLNRMEEEGILVSEYKANSRFFELNKGYPLSKELKSIFYKQVNKRKNA